MAGKKEDDLLGTTTFKEKIEEHTFDILVGLMVLLVAFEIWEGRRNGVILQNNNSVNVEQTLKSVKSINQAKTINFNDSLNHCR